MRRHTWMKRSNALITLGAAAGILVILNLLASNFVGRVDLTENHLNSLSPYSVDVLRELTSGEGGGELLVRVYASRELPDSEKMGPGMERDIRGVEQKLMDVLEEYRARADGRLVLEKVEEDVESRGEEAGLEPFVGEKTELTEGEKGRFEMKQYVLGLTLHFKGVMEVVPKALEPGLYEYELTRAMIRLRDKVADQRTLEDMFRAADELKGLMDRCHEQVTAYTPKEDSKEELSGIEGLLKPIENLEQEVEALVKNRDLVDAACRDLMPRFEAVRGKYTGRHRRFDAFLTGDTHDENVKGGVEGMAFAADRLVTVLSGPEPQAQEVGKWKDIIASVKNDVEAFHKELKESAGQQKLGFLCERAGFCPIPSDEPIFNEQALQAAAAQNQQFVQILQYHAQMEQQLRQLLLNIRNQLFRQQDFDVVRVVPGTPVPDEVKALVIFGVREELKPQDLYWVDQYLMGGGTVIVFASRYDVNIGLFSADAFMASGRRQREPDRYDVEPVNTSLWSLLESWGVRVEPSLVMDPGHAGRINLPHVVRRDNIEFRGTKDFDYPLFLHATEMDQENVLVRSLPGILLPFVSPLEFSPPEGADLTATALVSSSSAAVAFPRPERYYAWSRVLSVQEKAGRAAAQAWTVVAERKGAADMDRTTAGGELKRLARPAVEELKTIAGTFVTMASEQAGRDGGDAGVALKGRATDLADRADKLLDRLSTAEDKDLEALARTADETVTLAGELRTELAAFAWKPWTETFGGEPGEDDPPRLELLPATQIDLAARMEGKASRPLVMLVEGTFRSRFADGSGLPEGLTGDQKKERLASGTGRLLVVGSDLGLQLPSPDQVFKGLDPANFVPGPELMMPQLRVDNWQLRIGQVGRSLSMDGIPFLLNTLDWSVQRMALADIRAKQNPQRRIRAVDSGTSQTLIQVAWVGGLPLLFLLFGAGLWQWRTLRRRSLRAAFAAPAKEVLKP